MVIFVKCEVKVVFEDEMLHSGLITPPQDVSEAAIVIPRPH